MSSLVTIKIFDNYITAHIYKSRLEAEGIVCFLKDENTVTMHWLWSNAIGGIKLQVLETEKEKAEQLLQEEEEEIKKAQETPGFWEENTKHLNPDNKICIHCGSKNTRQMEYEKIPSIWMWLFFGFPLLFKSKKWHCFHCGKKI